MVRREAGIEETGFGIDLCLIPLAALEDLLVDIIGEVLGRVNEIVVPSCRVRKVDHANDHLAPLLLLVLGDGRLAIEWIEEEIVRVGSTDDFS